MLFYCFLHLQEERFRGFLELGRDSLYKVFICPFGSSCLIIFFVNTCARRVFTSSLIQMSSKKKLRHVAEYAGNSLLISTLDPSVSTVAQLCND